jgi:hypothetical protein
MKGIHKYRFLDTATVDYIGTFVLALVFTKITRVPLVLSTIGMFLIGILCHMFFHVETSATSYLFNIWKC